MLLSVGVAGREAAAAAAEAPAPAQNQTHPSWRRALISLWCPHAAVHTALPLAYGAVVVAIWFSTVYCGFHYVSDVICGVGLAAVVGSWRTQGYT